MRIIAGKYRGRKIKQPKLVTVRPTKDRIREAVFSIIAGDIPGAAVLDLFAGTGAYGLEALSRGAGKAVFLEKDNKCGKILSENVRMLNADEYAEVIVDDTFKGIKALGEEEKKFDVIFSDPPYNRDMAKKTLIMVNCYDILNSAGLLIIEHSYKEDIPVCDGNVSILKQKTYGKISVSVYSNRNTR